MPVTLASYINCAKNRRSKFITAIKSFLDQFNVSGHELVIVSDGCLEAKEVYETMFSDRENIRFIMLDKQPYMSGTLRQAGIEASNPKNKWICYLDSDDMFGIFHLAAVIKGIRQNPDVDWIYWDDIMDYPDQPVTKEVSIEHGSIGTSSIAHRRNLPVSWTGCDGYGHDWLFISKLNILKKAKISGTSYHIRHIPNTFDV